MAISDLLRGCPLFYEFEENEIEKVTRTCSVYTYNPEQPVFKEGDAALAVYIVLKGMVEVRKETAMGPVGLQFLKAGDVFGELALMLDQARSASVIATQESKVLELKYESLLELFESQPKIFGILVLNVTRLVAKRLQEVNQLAFGTRG